MLQGPLLVCQGWSRNLRKALAIPSAVVSCALGTRGDWEGDQSGSGSQMNILLLIEYKHHSLKFQVVNVYKWLLSIFLIFYLYTVSLAHVAFLKSFIVWIIPLQSFICLGQCLQHFLCFFFSLNCCCMSNWTRCFSWSFTSSNIEDKECIFCVCVFL